MSESMSDIINGCYACPAEALQDAAVVSLLARLGGAFTASAVTQSRVAVATDDVTLVAAAASTVKYREIQLQNLGTEVVFVRLGTGADATGSNGEFALKAGSAADDGTGGTYTVTGYIGVVTGASAGATNVSVTVIDLA